MKPIKVTVTREDIKLSAIDPYTCPIERALMRMNFVNPCVSTWGNIVASFCGVVFRYKPPRSVVRFARKFDAGERVKPFSFFLRPTH